MIMSLICTIYPQVHDNAKNTHLEMGPPEYSPKYVGRRSDIAKSKGAY